MNLIYLAAVRIPTEKAHGLTISKSCMAFAKRGVNVELWVPTRRNHIKKDLFSHYELEPDFSVRYISALEMPASLRSNIAFKLQTLFFYVVVIGKLLFGSRARILYTRDVWGICFVFLGYRVIYECHETPRNAGRIFAWWCSRAYRIVVTTATLEEFFCKQGTSNTKYMRAPNGVDLDIFSVSIRKEEARAQLNLPENARIVTYTGNFTTFGKDKGISTILASLTQVPDILFVAVGGSELDQNRYREEAVVLGVHQRVIFFGNAPQATLALHEAAADILLMPFPDIPHYRKHMSPVKMFEYLAAGKPIIASDLPTITEILTPEVAYIVPPDSPNDLAQAIRDIYADSSEANRRARRARELSFRFSWDARAERILSFLGMVN